MRYILRLFTLLLMCAAAPGWAATLESPATGAVLSGLGFISGWKCHAGNITVRIDDGSHIPVATGQPRGDVRHICGTLDHGFITQMNWALLGDGKHSIVAYDDGVKFASATFDVTTFDEEFVRDAEGDFALRDFPNPGETSYFEWNESTQHMELVDFSEGASPPDPDPPVERDNAEQQLQALIGTWEFTIPIENQRPLVRPYRFDRLIQSNAGWWALVGHDPLDQSTPLTALIVDLLPDAGLSQTFAMHDIDRLEGDYYCSTYIFDRQGDRLEGIYELATSAGPELGQCRADGALLRFTARRTR